MENKNGQGIFYGVIGVATLVVAIIGATFAYFSATASTNYVNSIAGETLNLTTSLSVSVTKLTFAGASAASPNLVPATLATDQVTGDPTAAGITDALEDNCEKGGYTGCHVYKIEASSSSLVNVAQIKLSTLTTTNTTNESDWKYVIYTGTDASATTVIDAGEMNLASPVDMHSSTQTLDSNGAVYYLMIYLQEDNDQNSSQNDGAGNDATGSYSGTIELTAADGSVTANFTA